MSSLDPEAIERRLESAEAVVVEEQTQTADELDALEAFATRLREMDLTTSKTTLVPAIQATNRQSVDRLQTVREAYESTFMAVPHYDEEFDESYARNLTEEFGPDVASLLVHGTGFRDQHRQTVLAAVSTSREGRERLLDILDDEHDSITTAREVLVPLATELAAIEAEMPSNAPKTLDAQQVRLDVLEDKCDDLLEDRQAVLVSQRHALGLPIDEVDIPRYLYRTLDTDHPVVSTIANLLDSLETLRIDIAATLGRGFPARHGRT